MLRQVFDKLPRSKDAKQAYSTKRLVVHVMGIDKDHGTCKQSFALGT